MGEKLSSGKIAFMIQLLMIAGNGVTIPRIATEVSGTGAWFSILISTIVGIPISYMFVYLGLKYKESTIYEYSEVLVGKKLSIIIVIIFIMFFFIEFISSIAYSAYFINYTFFPKTPIWVLKLVMVMAVLYCVLKGLNALCKTFIIYSILNYCSIILFFFLILYSFNKLNIYPIFNISETGRYLKGSAIILNAFVDIIYLSVIPFSQKANYERIYKYMALGILGTGIVYSIYTEFSIGVFGQYGIQRYNAPIIDLARITEGGYAELIGRIDGIMFIFFVMFNIGKLVASIYAVTILLKKIITKIPYNTILVMLLLFGYILSYFIKDANQVLVISRYNKLIGIFGVTVIPGMLIVISKIKKVKLS